MPSPNDPVDARTADDPAATADSAPATQDSPVDVVTGGQAPPAIPGYKILEELGHGSMGVVYRAIQLTLKRFVALKVIRSERLVSPHAVSRFCREMEAAARVLNPHIVTIFHADQVGGTHFFSMEYVEGVDLRKLLRERGPLPVEQACEFIRQVAMGLQHIHERGLVHRDLKPSNLIVKIDNNSGTRRDVVKILDLGLARVYETNDSPSVGGTTSEGVMLGTPDYMAPEQIEDPRQVDIRADLYSLGCTFYHLLTGRVPFPGDKLIHKLDGHRWKDPVPVESLRSDLSGDVVQVVRRLMAKRAEDRFATPDELMQALSVSARGSMVPISGLSGASPDRVGELAVWSGHTDRINSLALSSDGQHALSGSLDRTVRQWDVASGQELRRIEVPGGTVTSVALSPINDQFLAGCGDALGGSTAIHLFDLHNAQELRRFEGHTGAVMSLSFSPDGCRAVSGSSDGTARVWEVNSGQQLAQFVGHGDMVACAVFTRDGQAVVSGGHDGTVQIWSSELGRSVAALKKLGSVRAVALSPDGTVVAIAAGDIIRLWDLSSSAVVVKLKGHRDVVSTIDFSPDGRLFASGSVDRTIRVWDLIHHDQMLRFDGHTDRVTRVVFAPNGRRLLSSSDDKTLRVWGLPAPIEAPETLHSAAHPGSTEEGNTE